MFGVSKTDEVTKRPHVREIHLGAFDKAFPDVGEVGAQHRDLVAGFHHGEPSLDRIDADAQVSRHIRQIQELSASGRQNPEKILIPGQVAHLPQGANVPLETGLEKALLSTGSRERSMYFCILGLDRCPWKAGNRPSFGGNYAFQMHNVN